VVNLKSLRYGYVKLKKAHPVDAFVIK